MIAVQQYTKAKRPAGFKIAPLTDLNSPEPGYYRAPQLQPVLIQNNKPVQNQLSQADINALNDPEQRE